MKLYIADAFTDKVFGGNPAGIVILETGEAFPDKKVMQRTAAELRYSETVFVKKISESVFKLRYFTPVQEVELCGHATIAAFICLMDAKLAFKGCDYTAETLSGSLNIKVDYKFAMMEMAPPEHLLTISDQSDIDELYAALGIKTNPERLPDSCRTCMTLRPMVISTGLPDIILPVGTQEALNSIRPDFKRISALSKRYGSIGIYAFTIEKKAIEITARARSFAPLCGIDEEAATGTAAGALTYYLYGYGFLNNEKESLFIQGETMGRPSMIYTHIRETEDSRTSEKAIKIQIGGSAAIVAKGEIFL